MKKYRIVVVGIGLVGKRILQVLQERDFPIESVKVLARSARTETVNGVDYEVIPAAVEAFDGADIALFAGTEGEKGASTQMGWEAVQRGCVVIDNGNDFPYGPPACRSSCPRSTATPSRRTRAL